MADNTLTDMAETGKTLGLLFVPMENLDLIADLIVSVIVTVQTVK